VPARATENVPTVAAPPVAPAWEELGELGEYQQLCRSRLDHLVDVREPLVLISQIQRSGGTLLSRLLDGHPECHAHPYELKIGHRRGNLWPALKLDQPGLWFSVLFEQKAADQLVAGYSKPGRKTMETDVFPFLFLPRLQKQIFDQCVASRPIERVRDVLDCYFTSYFNAWLDNQNLYSGPKRVVTAFTPRLSSHRGSTKRFMAAYPDGALVSIVREPRAWYASAFRHKARFAPVGNALAVWRESVEAALDAVRRWGDRVVVLTYEDLVLDTEGVMGRLAERIGISMSPTLLVPTFNGRPVRANSSDPVEAKGILPERTQAYRDLLDEVTIEQVDELAGDLYEQARAVSI